MKPMGLAVFLIVLVWSAFVLAQDLSSFYGVSGFHLPLLRSGQYSLSVSPSYHRASARTSMSDSSADYLAQNSSEHSDSYVEVSSALLYGLTNRTTASLCLVYLPEQSLGHYNSRSLYDSPLTRGTGVQVIDEREERFGSVLVLAHRPRRDCEISLTGSYYWNSFPARGTSGSDDHAHNIRETDRSHSYGITLDIVFLGN